jgi:K+/H+ antiporter YhaU regulatory subunit KhtT
VLALCVYATVRGGEPANPEVFLRRDKGLAPIPGGSLWLSRTEQHLREHVRRLDGLKRQILNLQSSLEERCQNNLVLWQTNRGRIGTLRKALSSLNTDDPKKKQIERQIKELEAQAVEPRRLPAEADVRTRLIELTNLRNRLGLSVIAIRRLKVTMDSEYKQLAGDPDVTAALRQLGESHRLGPTKSGYAAEIRQLAEYERVAFSDWSPLYVQSGKMRVGAILNERTPVTFTWQTSNEPTVLTASIAESAGVNITDSAEVFEMPFGRSRRLPTRRVDVRSIRFGELLLNNVTAYVLPPEGEDLGARIGSEAFGENQATVELERLRLVIQPN